MGDFKAVIFDLDGTLYKSKFLPLLCVLKSPKDAFRMRAERLARRGAKGFEWDSVTSMEADFAQRIARFSGGSAVAVSQWRLRKFPQIQADVLKNHCSAREGFEILSAPLLLLYGTATLMSGSPLPFLCHAALPSSSGWLCSSMKPHQSVRIFIKSDLWFLLKSSLVAASRILSWSYPYWLSLPIR